MREKSDGGWLSEKIDGTKKIEEWEFRASGALLLNPKIVAELAVRGPLVASVNVENSSNGYSFAAKSKWFEPLNDRDLNKLKARVTKAFSDSVLSLNKLMFEEWIEVQIQGDRSADDNEPSASLSVSYEFVRRGRGPGVDFIVTENGNLSEWPKPKAAGVEREDRRNNHGRTREIYYQDSNAQYAYIPRTEANVAALDAILDNIALLNTRLQAVLAQNVIAKSLLQTSPLRITLK